MAVHCKECWRKNIMHFILDQHTQKREKTQKEKRMQNRQRNIVFLLLPLLVSD